MPVHARRTSSSAVASLAGSAFSLLAPALPALAQPLGFPAVFELSSLLPENGGDGTSGFVINGVVADDRGGISVSTAGDMNGDGVADLIIGAYRASPYGNYAAGETYVVFGRSTGFPASLDPAALDGTTGFRLKGIDARDLSGWSVSDAGDVNGDGIDDVIVGAFFADPGGHFYAGESYVMFGQTIPFKPNVHPSSLDGTTGFRLDGIDADDQSGVSVSAAGDVNGDGIDDVIIGARYADPIGGDEAGETYVVFGRASGFPPSIGLGSLNGATGFRLNGIDGLDFSGRSVSAAGDVNADGIDDVIVGAFAADPGGDSRAGESYVVFGRTTGFPSQINLSSLDGTTGFRLDGVDPPDASGWSVSAAGDFNGDGIDDVIVGARAAAPGGNFYAGSSYVVFGRSTPFPTSIDLSSLDGVNGVRLDGIDPEDHCGWSVSGAGDVNGDGIDDVIIGARYADRVGGSKAGESYVVFGRTTGFPAAIALSSLDGTTGFRLDGIDANDFSGASVSAAGDVNDDGLDDLVIGASRADPGGRSNAGETYVVFGRRSCRADYNNDHTLDAFDYDDFVSAYFDYVNNGTGFPDYNHDTYVDAFDYDDFVSDFFTGCA